MHPGHAWVKVVEPNLVTVGVDEFTRSVFGSVEELALPEPGVLIRQGGKGWRLKRGERRLDQTAPITGRVVEVNRDLVQRPHLLGEKDTLSNWILKVRPVSAPESEPGIDGDGTHKKRPGAERVEHNPFGRGAGDRQGHALS